MSPAASANAIDALMEAASRSLVATRYFEASDRCQEALRLARTKDDFGRMARICLPLQEARRWIRQEALDARRVAHIASAEDLGPEPAPGCYLVAPPLIGVDARQIRVRAWDLGIPVFVLCREPLTRDGHWPLVGVGEAVVRARIDPPPGVEGWTPGSGGSARPMSGDRVTEPITPEWFAAAGEALGDRAIADAQAAARPDDGADALVWAVDDHLDRLEACPEHEKLIQTLARACRAAIGASTPRDRRRRRGPGQDDRGF